MRYLLLVLASCCDPLPLPNVAPQTFAAEYEALTLAGADMSESLNEIEFVRTSTQELQQWCDSAPCLATTHGSTIIFAWSDITDHCKFEPNPRGGVAPLAGVIIHEIAHVQGYNHGSRMDKVQSIAWVLYRDAECIQ